MKKCVLMKQSAELRAREGLFQIIFRGQDWGQKYTARDISFTYKYIENLSGGPRRIRTPDPLIRSQVLYPAELSVHCAGR